MGARRGCGLGVGADMGCEGREGVTPSRPATEPHDRSPRPNPTTEHRDQPTTNAHDRTRPPQVTEGGKNLRLGDFPTAEDAALFYAKHLRAKDIPPAVGAASAPEARAGAAPAADEAALSRFARSLNGTAVASEPTPPAPDEAAGTVAAVGAVGLYLAGRAPLTGSKRARE